MEMAKKLPVWLVRPVLLLLFIVAVVAGCDCDGVSTPDVISPGAVEITGPEDGSLVNLQVIPVRGRAELGTLVRVYVDGAFRGSALTYATEPPQELGNFHVDDVDLGLDEVEKTIVAVAGDEQGNTAAYGDTVRVVLDLTPPPGVLERIEDATEVEPGIWEAATTPVDVYARTDTTAIIVRVRSPLFDYLPDEYEVFPGNPGEPDSMRVRFEIGWPIAAPSLRDTSVQYALQTIDAADNYTQTFFEIRWPFGEGGGE
jgi:hypothetical protein